MAWSLNGKKITTHCDSQHHYWNYCVRDKSELTLIFLIFCLLFFSICRCRFLHFSTSPLSWSFSSQYKRKYFQMILSARCSLLIICTNFCLNVHSKCRSKMNIHIAFIHKKWDYILSLGPHHVNSSKLKLLYARELLIVILRCVCVYVFIFSSNIFIQIWNFIVGNNALPFSFLSIFRSFWNCSHELSQAVSLFVHRSIF